MLSHILDDILIWSKDPMAEIKSLEKIYLLKNVGIPEYFLIGNEEFIGESWTTVKNEQNEDVPLFLHDIHKKFKIQRVWREIMESIPLSN